VTAAQVGKRSSPAGDSQVFRLGQIVVLSPRIPHHAFACVAAGLENSPSKVAASEKPLLHLRSIEAVVSAASLACAAPPTTKDAPDSAWKVAVIERSGL
jgi:hypothetical protein